MVNAEPLANSIFNRICRWDGRNIRLTPAESPPHNIVAFLKEGRYQLRQKYRLLREKFRVAENQVRAVTKSREILRAQNDLAIVGSPFGADIMVRVIRLVLEGALSLLVGLYMIQRIGQRRRDWIRLLDHTINAGSSGCLSP